MKTVAFFKTQFLIERILLTFVCLCYLGTTSGQVITTKLNGAAIEKYVPHYNSSLVNVFEINEVDVQSKLEEDARLGRSIARFGVKMPINITKSDGSVEHVDNNIIWKAAFYSKGAISLNFELEDLNLPKRGQIYIYNKDASIVSGPIESHNIFHRKYSTDVINGNTVIIQAIIPETEYDKFSINISNVIHGFVDIGPYPKEELNGRAYDDALACEVDINCTVGSLWSYEADAVALILVDNEAWCSGALINSSCQEFEGYFLTAEHCVEGATGYLDWTFRFNYDSPDPTEENDCHGTEPASWLTYSGADVISQWSIPSGGSDFSLLDLQGSVIGKPTLSLAGWNRTDYAPSNGGVLIHHPEGDVKKISIDDDALNIEALGGGSGTNFLRTIWDLGLAEPGSSGGPLFDAFSKKIVGQVWGGEDPASCLDSDPYGWSGRLFKSWTGGGTSTTRLSDWLGSQTSMGLIRSPYITTTTLTAPLCSDANRSYLLNNLTPGKSATWAVTPSTLFATTGGASTSGSGVTAVVRAATNAYGLGTLTYTISASEGCNTIPVSKDIWVGKPGGYLEGDTDICIGEEGIVSINWPATNTLMGVSSTVWTYSGPIDDFDGGPALVKYSSATAGTGYIYCARTNACGTQNISIPYRIRNCERNGDILVNVYPNPTSNNIFISLKDNEKNIDKYVKSKSIRVNIYNKFGALVQTEYLLSDDMEINTSQLLPDFYIVEVMLDKSIIRNKVIIQ